MNASEEWLADSIQLIKQHEGFRSRPYHCTAGKLTVGYGRNLEDVGISRTEAEQLLRNDALLAADTVKTALGNETFERLDASVRAALVSMAFNLGRSGFLGFRKMLAAIDDGNYHLAAKEVLDSKYADQVPNRANDIANAIRSQA